MEFVDGKMVNNINNKENLMHNWEYNGWKSDVFWKCVLCGA